MAAKNQPVDTIERARTILVDIKAAHDHEEILKKVEEYLQAKDRGSTPEKCLINDAIHGPIELSPLMYQIINTPEFHRLKDIHQLGAAHYVYPGANHTRFDHSIGVCYLAKVFAESLREQFLKDYGSRSSDPEYKFDPEEVLCAQIAGLCHDLGHGPLSHMFEHAVVSDILKDKEKKEREHELLSVAIFKRIMENPKVLAEFVHEKLSSEHVKLIGEMIRPEKHPTCKRLFLYEIVANKNTGIDVDKWDYYARDCHYLGVEHDFQWRRCMLLGRIVTTPKCREMKSAGKLRIAFRDKELDNLYGMFRTRAVLHQKAYQHKTIKAVEKMIGDAFLRVQDLRIIRIAKDSKSIKEAVELAYAKPPDLKWYLALSDSIVGTIQCADACTKELCEKLEEAQKLLKRVEERDLYSCVANIRIPVLEDPKNVSAPDPASDKESEGSDESASAPTSDESDEIGSSLEVAAKIDHDRDSKKKFSAPITDESDVTGLNLKVLQKFDDDKNAKKEFVKEIWKAFKDADDKETDAEDNLWLAVVKIKLSSEGDGDPVKSVLFYKKGKGSSDSEDIDPVCRPTEIAKKTSKLVVPQAFVEYELRVYDKREAKKRDKDGHDRRTLKTKTEDTLENWRKDQLSKAPNDTGNRDSDSAA